MTDHPGDYGKRNNLDPTARQTDHLPIPKTGAQKFQHSTDTPLAQLECLTCAYFRRIIEAGGNKPETIDDQPLAEMVSMLPPWLAECLHGLLAKQLAATKTIIFPCLLEELLRNESLQAVLGARLLRSKNLGDVITDAPVIFIDERQKLFFYRAVPIPLRPITFCFLLILAQTPEQFVPRDEIYHCLWPGEANYQGTNKPYEGQVSDHKRKFMAEVKQAITGKLEIAANELETFIATRKKLGYMLNFAKENIVILKKNIVVVALVFLLDWGDYFSDVVLDASELLFLW